MILKNFTILPLGVVKTIELPLGVVKTIEISLLFIKIV